MNFQKLVFALLALLSMGLAGCSAFSLFATASPTPSLTPTNTITPSPTLTSTPTPEPTATPTPTPIPTAASELFEGEGFELLLPSSYSGGSSLAEVNEIIEYLRSTGSEQLAAALEQNRSLFKFVALDSVIDNEGLFPTYVNVVSFQNPVLKFLDAEAIVQLTVTQLAGYLQEFELVSQGDFIAGDLEGYKLTSAFSFANITTDFAAAQYIFVEDDILWVLTFGTVDTEFSQRAPQFDESAASFRLVE